MTAEAITPAAAGYRMPPEWEPHAATLMAWPVRRELWGERLEEAKGNYATVARAIAAFEPVVMACPPALATEVRDRCGAGVEPLEIPIDDSWARDSGPIFVRDAAGRVAAVKFGFNAWGDRWHPYANDALLPDRVAAHLGVPLFEAPMILEGGSIAVDGAGTLVTTGQCLLNPNRNPGMTRGEIEAVLRGYLGVDIIVWLPFGHPLDVGPEGTDGHIDGVLAYAGPGHVILEASPDPAAVGYGLAQANRDVLRTSRDAAGRGLRVTLLDPGTGSNVAYANHYVANGAVIVPVDGRPEQAEIDAQALAVLAGAYPGREVVAVPGEVLAAGGGGPHCITQQVPVASPWHIGTGARGDRLVNRCCQVRLTRSTCKATLTACGTRSGCCGSRED
jgi:agmatine deiminase